MNCSRNCLLLLRYLPGYYFHKYTQSITDNYTEGKMTILPLVKVNFQLTRLAELGRRLAESFLY